MVNIPIPSDPCKAATSLAVQVPLPVYLVAAGFKSLSEVLVDFEAHLLDESLAQGAYAHLQELTDLQREAELAEQMRLQKAAALAEEPLRQAGAALLAAARRVQDKAEMARSGWHSEEDSELDSKRVPAFALDPRSIFIHINRRSSSPSPSSSSCSSSDAEVAPLRPVLTKTKAGRAPRKQKKPKAKPYDRPTRTSPAAPRQQFVDHFPRMLPRRPLRANEYWVHAIDWDNAPLVWDGQPIPRMAAALVMPWINASETADDGVCKFKICSHPEGRRRSSGLKSHILSRAHLYVRLKCHLCRFTDRPDNFDKRHDCARRRKNNAAIIQADPGWPAPSYPWLEEQAGLFGEPSH